MNLSASLQRVVRAATFDVNFYREVKDNPALNREALLVVIFSTVIASLGSLGDGFWALISTLIAGIIGYYLWAYVTRLVGGNFFQGTATNDQLLRTLGYAYAPKALGLLGFFWCIGPIVAMIGFVWMLATGILAVREAHAVDTNKAVAITIVGWIILVIIQAILFGIFVGFGAAF